MFQFDTSSITLRFLIEENEMKKKTKKKKKQRIENQSVSVDRNNVIKIDKLKKKKEVHLFFTLLRTN